MKKRLWGTLIVSALIINLLFPLTAIAAETSGSCGEGVSWKFDASSGTLTISGEGGTDDFDAIIFASKGEVAYVTDPAPWEALKPEIRTAIVEEGIGYLGQSAFRDCANLQDVSLPSSLIIIANFAFLHCTQLEQVVIPENVSYIGCNVFVGNEYEGLPYACFLGDAPEVKGSGEGNRSFSNGTTLYYMPQNDGWTSGTWNGYTVDTWDGHDLPELRGADQWEEPWLEERPGSNDIEVQVIGTECYSYAYEVVEKVNELRDSLGLQKLELDDNLMKAAMQRAAECSAYYSHTRPDNTDCTDIFPPARAMGENIAAGQLTPEAAMDSWTNSSGHYQNMVNTGYTKIGVGCFKSGNQYYWTQAFASGKADEHTKRTDSERAVSVTINQDHFMLHSNAPELLLKVGESVPVPLYIENTGFYNAETLIRVSNVNFRYSSAVSISLDSMMVTGEKSGKGEIEITISNGASTIIPVSVVASLQDVPETSWYYDAVTWADNHHVIDCISPGTFSPNGQMSRGATAIMLYRLENSPMGYSQSVFGDVRGSELTAAANWVNSAGLMNGYGNGAFGPDDPLTREQMAAILFRYNAYKGNTSSNRADLSCYSDAGEIGSYAVEAMSWANAQGLIQGTDIVTMSPKKEITRAEAATVFMRFCGE